MENMSTEISGQWMNPKTGQTVFARSIINDGNVALVVTDVGTIPMDEFSAFVQMGEEVSGGSQITPNQTPNFGGLMSEEDKILLNGLNNPKPQHHQSLDKPLTMHVNQTSKVTQIETTSENFKIIDKLFSKFKDNQPKLNISINWNGFPKDQLTTLINIFDVPKEEILDYIIDNLLNKEKLKEDFQTII